MNSEPFKLKENLLTIPWQLFFAAGLASILGPLTLAWLVPGTSLLWIPAGVLYGLLSVLLLGPRATDPGRGLMWNLGFGFICWCFLLGGEALLERLGISGPLIQFNPLHALGVLLLGFATPVGLVLGTGQILWNSQDSLTGLIEWNRAVVIGGLSGLLGGWTFSVWMQQVGMFPLIAGIAGSNSPSVGFLIHFLIAMVIGITFGLLFEQDTRRIGSSLAWGMAYGIYWWLLGALTLLPLFLGESVSWNFDSASQQIGTFVGHIVYGLVIGFVYSLIDRIWQLLFYESDPLNREFSGPGIRTFIAIYRSWVPSLIGSLVFGYIMWRTGVLTTVAKLVGSSSSVVGFLVHMVVGSIIGMTYGRLFRYESPDLASGATWGMVYGLIWWFLGPLTLLPSMLNQPLAWSASTIQNAYPSLIGHLMYGIITGIGFYLLERRHQAWAILDPRIAKHEKKHRRPVGTPAPAVWLFIIGLGMIMPFILV